MFQKLSGKQTTHSIGQQAEIQAKRYLEQQGLRFIEANYSCKLGELDLIMDHAGQLVFVEVKYRKSPSHGLSIEMVGQKKQKRIILAARYYLHQNQLTEAVSTRFDIIGVEPNNHIQWLRNAFYPK